MAAKKKAVLSVAQSTIDGLGCFTGSTIEPEILIGEYVGELINFTQAKRRDNPNSECYSPYIVAVSENCFIDGAVGGNSLRFLNHSCNPNCRLLRKENRVLIVSAKRIEENDELTIDYALNDEDEFECRCGTVTCKNNIEKGGLK